MSIAGFTTAVTQKGWMDTKGDTNVSVRAVPEEEQ